MGITRNRSRKRTIAAVLLAAVMAAPVVPLTPTGHTPVAEAATGNISGRLFRDDNWNGTRDAGDGFVGGVTIRAYGENNTVLRTTTTSTTTGAWTLNNVVGPARIEVDASTLPTGMYEGVRIGAGSQPFTFFADGGQSGFNIPVVYPAEYIGPDATGAASATAPATVSTTDPAFTVVTQWQDSAPGNYDAARTYGAGATALAGHTGTCDEGQVGSTFGIVYSPINGAVYMGAYPKMGTDLAAQSTTIFRNCSPWVTLPGGNTTVSTGTVGRQGIGGMDVASDLTGLWAVNMSREEIVRINWNGTIAETRAIPNRCGAATTQSMGLTVKDGSVFVGSSCEGNLNYYVNEFDEASNSWSLAMNGTMTTANREPTVSVGVGLFGNCADAQTQNIQWQTWTNNYSNMVISSAGCPTVIGSNPAQHKNHRAQMLVSDVDFMADGSMVVAIRDRVADLFPNNAITANGVAGEPTILSHGDLVRATWNGSTYIEETGSGFTATEVFKDTYESGTPDFTAQHAEPAQGAVYVSPATGNVLATIFDPIDCRFGNSNGAANALVDVCAGTGANQYNIPIAIDETGIRYYRPNGGFATDALAIQHGGASDFGAARPRDGEQIINGFSKANGLGDIAAQTNRAPIAVGNRVWIDVDGDGVQDGSEWQQNAAGVTVQLLNAGGTVIATDVTDANGEYRFYLPGSTTAGTQFSVRVPDGIAGAPTGVTVAGDPYVFTATNVGNDNGDSDGVVSAAGATATFTIPGVSGASGSGATLSTLDFGLEPVSEPDLALRKLNNETSVPDRAGGPYQPGDEITWTFRVNNQSDRAISDIDVIDYIPAGLEYVTGSPAWAAQGANRVATIASIAAGGSADVTITLRVTDTVLPSPTPFANDADAYLNRGEIIDFTDPFGLDDADSTPDTNPDNDPVIDDEFANPSPAGDEDDHDIAPFEVVVPPDAALIKEESQPFTKFHEHSESLPLVGDILHYDITVENQGITDLTDVVVQDFLPDGTQFFGGDVAWAAGSGNDVTYTIPTLDAGETVVLGIEVQVTTVLAANLENIAEIIAMTDPYGLDDVDSTPDTDPLNDVVINDELSLTPATGDEDDNDPEPFEVVAPAPAIDVEKLIRTFDDSAWVDADDDDPATGDPYAAQAPMVNYQFIVTNPGNVPLSNVELTDDVVASWAIDFISGDDDADGMLDVTETWLYEGSWFSPPWEGPEAVRTNIADIDAEWIPGFGNPIIPVNDDDPATYWTRGIPEIEIVKRINGFDANDAPGVPVDADSEMQVTYEIKNTGTAPLEDVLVTDDLIPFGDITCPQTELDVSEEMVCTAPWPAPALEVQHTNTGTVDAVYYPLFGDPEPVTDDDPANAWSRNPAGIHVEKYISLDDADTVPGVMFAEGDTMTVTFEVTNTAEAPLSNVTLIDDVIGDVTGTFVSGDDNGDNLLDPSETWLYETTYPAPAAGELHQNVATVTGDYTDLSGTTTYTDADPANAWTPGIPQIEVIKYINGDDASNAPGVQVAAGSLMDVTFDVTNIGNVELVNVVVFDDTIDQDDITCPQNSLLPGETMTCDATYPAPNPGDQHTNVATATGDYIQPDGQFIEVTDDDPANAYVGPAPEIELTKYINYNDANEQPGVNVPAGSDMTVTFEVTNIGGVDLVNVAVVDDVIGAITCPQDTLAIGETILCETTLAAPAPGTIHTNTAEVTGEWTNPLTDELIVVDDNDPANAWVMGAPAIEIIKFVEGDDANRAPGIQVPVGSDMTFTMEVTNVGDVPLDNVVVTDDIIATSDIVCPQTSLAVGETMTCDATYPAPDPGVQHTNTAEVVGSFTQPNGQIVQVGDDDPANAWTAPPPAIELTKFINEQDANVTPGVGVPVDSDMTVTFEITNTGGVDLENLTLVDDVMGDLTALCPQTTLAVGETIECETTHPAPAAGTVHSNLAVVDAVYVNPVGEDIPVTDEDPAHAWTPGRPALTLVKTINGEDANSPSTAVLVAADDPMTIEFLVTNTGDVALSNVAVTDDVIPQGDITCPQDILAVGESMTCDATFPGPADGATHTNTGTATGEFVQPNGQLVEVTDDDPAHAYADDTPDIQIVKYINGDDANALPGINVPEGSMMDVTFEVTNLQPVSLENVVVTDDVMGPITCPTDMLAPAGDLGDSMLCSGNWPAPAPGEVHTNVATVVGDHTYPDGEIVEVTDADPANAWVTGTPQIEVIKFVNDDDANLAPGVRTADGDTMQFTFEIRNTGNVALTDVWLHDDFFDQQDITCDGAVAGTPNMVENLPIGGVVLCTAEAPAPGPGEFHTNTAEVEGSYVQPDGTRDRVGDEDPANAYTPGGPAIDIEKYITDTDAAAGFVDGYGADDQVTLEDADTQDEAAYVLADTDMDISYVVTNTGDVTLENVLVTDPTIGSSNIFCEATILAPGEQTTCTATFPAPEPGTFHTNTGFVRGDYRPFGGTPQQVRDNDPAWAYVKLVDLSLDKQVWAGGLIDNDDTFIAADNAVEGEAGIVKLDRPFQYQVTVTNTQAGERPDSATMVTVRDLIDVSEAIELTAATPSQGTCDLATGLCDLGTIASGDSVTIIIDAVLPRTNLDLIPEGEFMVNDAEVASQHEVDVDSTPGNGFEPDEDDDNPAWVEIRLADLELIKSIEGIDNGVDDNGVADREDGQDESKVELPFAIGEQATWTIEVINNGPDQATDVTVNDVLPAEFVYVTSDGDYDPATDTWTIGSIDADGTAVLNIEAVLAPDWAFDQDAEPGRNVNVAEVMTANEDDPDSFVGDGVTDADDIDDAHADSIVGSLGDYVWHDIDGDGIQDADEPVVADVPVTLTWQSDVVDSLGTVIVPSGTVLTTTTDATGFYMFTNLYGGDYEIAFEIPSGFEVTGQDEGSDDAVDSDADDAGIINMNLAPGAADPTNDTGIYVPASIGDFVWEDLNANGVQDAGEPGIAGVTVNLVGHDWVDDVALTATTDANGAYLFDGLRPGNYHVEVVLPDGTVATGKDVTADNADSDINPQGKMAKTQLVSGENDMTWDAGVYEPVAIGDYVWFDVDRDGKQDGNETGVKGVNVTLTGTDGLGNPVSETTKTDADGAYLFDGLRPGDYQVNFDLPAGWEFSPKNAGAAGIDSNANADGTTDPVTLVSGGDDLTIDAGLFQIIDLSIEKSGQIESKPLGEVTWTFTVTNNGPSVAMAGATVIDRLPNGLNFHELTVPEGWECTTPEFEQFENGVIDCTSTKSMKVGDTATFVVDMHVNEQYTAAWFAAERGSIVAEWTNVASVSANPQQFDVNPDNDRSDAMSAATVVLSAPPVATGSDALPVALMAMALFGIGGLFLFGGFRRRRRVTA